MHAILTDRALVSEDVLRLRFRPAAGFFPDAAPGAHVALKLPVGARRYSLTRAAPDLWELHVLRVQPSGGGSSYLHERVAIGDQLAVEGPFDEFPLPARIPGATFVAGGIGITPLLPMMRALEAREAPWSLHWAARHLDRFFELEPALAARALRYAPGLTRLRLDVPNLLRNTPVGHHVFVCGPRGLMLESQRLWQGSGRRADGLHLESFGARVDGGEGPALVRLVRSASEFILEPGTTLLDALSDRGFWIPSDCRRGECASCVVDVAGGLVDHRDVCLTPAQRGRMLCTCVSRPAGPALELDV